MSNPASPSASTPSIASSSAISSFFDTYICREPAGDAPLLIRNGPDEYTALLRTLQRSADHFSEKNQTRVLERIYFEQARLHMQHQQWKHALRILTPLWQSLGWRRSGWWLLLEEVDFALRECARHVGDPHTLLAVQWEMLNTSLTPRQDSQIDISTVLKELKPLRARPIVKLKAENVVSCVSAGFAFGVYEGNVGVPLRSQLVLTSHAHSSSEPITLKRVDIAFEGGLKGIHLQHFSGSIVPACASSLNITVQDISLQRPASDDDYVPLSPESPTKFDSLHGSADLTLAPSSSKAFSFADIPRTAGEANVSSIVLVVQEEDFDLEILITKVEHIQQDFILVQDGPKLTTRHAIRGRSSSVRIAPKPPKLSLNLSEQGDEYFTDEVLTLTVEVLNDEEDEVDVTLDARLVDSSDTAPSIRWLDGQDASNPLEGINFRTPAKMQRELGVLAQSGSQTHMMLMKAPSQPTDCALEIRARYYLKSDPETLISKAVTRMFPFSRPFEAMSTFSPVISADPWPDYFDFNGVEGNEVAGSNEDRQASGLIQVWSILARITSLAASPVVIEKIEIQVSDPPEDVHAASVSVDPSLPKALPPAGLQECPFNLSVQKRDLEDRRSAFLDLRLMVAWRREDSSGASTVALLPLPELVVPFGEPRVLASAYDGTSPLGVIHLSYVIENPSSYTLTFNITMETSEEFAFSGAKSVAVQMVPTSRHSMQYHILPLIKGAWISPQLKVYDTQFHKTLRIQGTEGMRNDKKGVCIWVDSDD